VYVAEILRKTIQSTRLVYQENEIATSSSFGVASLKDNSSYIEKTMSIVSLESMYEIKNMETINWEQIEKSKLEIAALLLKMADVALYGAKYSTCKKCGFSSEKYHLFIDEKCPNCGGVDVAFGRNKVVAFQEE
jgi:predicted Zn-ribbon and HTH transcriptional regulator